MRVIHGLFIVSTLLFVTGIGFVIAGARTRREAPSAASAAPAGPELVPVASVRQLMRGIVVPAARMVFASVGSIVTAQGIEEIAPKTDEEWEDVATNAASLVETGNLMLMNGRAIDREGWEKQCRALIDASKLVLNAASARNSQGVFDASAAIYDSCNGCHQTYMRQ